MFKRTFALSLLVAAAISARAQPSPTADDGTPVPAPAPAINALTPTGNAAGPLSLEDALGIAAESNPLLRAARSDADASVGTFIQAGARPNPSISFLQEGFGGQERTTTVLVNQTIELGGKRRTRLDVASYGREIALASLDGRAAALRADVADAFYGLLAAQRQLKVAEESADIAARSADMADKRARAGKVSPVEATKARVAATGVQIALAGARTRVTTALEKLVNVTGSAAARDRVATGNLDDIPEAEPLSQFLQRLDTSPVARAARAEMLRSNALVSVEKAKRVPDVTFSAGMKRVITGGRPDNQAVVGVSIPLPVFDTNKGAILEAVHKAAKADADFDGERARLQLELTQTYANYENSTQEARRLKADVLPAARESLDAMSRGYQLGKFSFLDVLDAQRTLFQGQSQYVQALTDAHRAYADLSRLSGSPLRSDLRTTANLP
ncbi:TolC family protein [Paraburkholderia fungorum]|jgi:cobalt-zinc-cadmium efflux system outer membrane protein|uniref:Cobalt-zinc-cadmium resistance protein CzcC n=1 Tax=Paraburkholderia fungorum TaxID=134537 RepID=A0AAU8SRC3_9BURK|nr:TolC family protein [Paraburkholderia fungorum]AJZ56386.1 cobalt-zinc-cadmium resistance protein CzcC [Paraburkholderia fungorum]MBB5545251.1 cobalt-zinc-cadmium efflux system outer membrane protein [Paraburkholderia fungorum]MBU7440646.1 TolC family protein [Paraburkholderia fungorum]MDE1006487.1 TolC family protein [Paraburkholderia fungorum]PNE59443.1 TolC family protein [Paraburkholderia fungorum]